MKIKEVKDKFAIGELDKSAFMDAMYKFHNVLEDFSKELKRTEVEKIEITDGKVIMTSRPTAYHQGGIRFIVDMEDKRTVLLFAFNFDTFESEDSKMIFHLVNPDSHVIDIGANIGWYSLHIGAMLKNGSIHSFEPLPETHKKLTDNIAINTVKNIHTNQIALSEKKQTLTFYYSPSQSGASSSRNITGNPDIVELKLESITFDDYAESKGLKAIDFIKCDVEGAELFVFQGAQKSLAKYKPIVFAELLRKWSAKFGYHPNDVFKIFHDLGYASFYAEKERLIRIPLVDENTEPTNFFFLHEQKHAGLIKNFAK